MSAWFTGMMRPNWLKFVTTSPAFRRQFVFKLSEVLPAVQALSRVQRRYDVTQVTFRLKISLART
jgi:hypothetical protein